MLDFWFNLPVPAMLAILAAVYGLIGVLIHVVTFRSRLRAVSKSLEGIVPQILAVVGLLFGLLTGFLAADIGEHNAQAARAVGAETNALHEVRTLSIVAASDMGDIRQALREFVRSEIQDEWPQMENSGRSAKTEAAFSNLLHEVADPRIAREAGPAVHSALINAVSQIGLARSQRLAISADATNTTKWITVFVLAIITQIAVGLVHLDRPRAQIAALTLFTCALVVALGMMAMQEWPFAGPLQVRPTPVEQFFGLIERSS
jgi:hypothetical protein